MTSYAYKWLMKGESLVRAGSDGSMLSIPADPANADYAAVVASGAVIAEPDPPPPPSQDEQDLAAAKAYAKLSALAAMTPAQVQAWVQQNVTNIAQAQDAIATLGIAVAILWRRVR